MRAQTIALFVSGIVLSGGLIVSEQARAQNAPPSAATQEASVKPIGKVVSAKGSVGIEHVNAVVVQASLGNQPGQAKVGDPIYLGDVVVTGADGQVGITFTDGTAFNLSSNARMVMTEFVYDPNSKENSTLLSLTKGTFTFVAGKIAKSGDMKIDTPVATMGIRGTTPHVEISDDGSVKFSTLIEEGKEQVVEKYGAVTSKQKASLSTDVIQESNKPNLTICRGC